jgi:hypothetical protein
MNDALVFSALPRQGRTPPIEDRHIVERVTKETAIKQLTDEEKQLHAEEREARQKQNKRSKKNRSSKGKVDTKSEQVLMDDSEPEKLFDKTGHLTAEHAPHDNIKHVDDYA